MSKEVNLKSAVPQLNDLNSKNQNSITSSSVINILKQLNDFILEKTTDNINSSQKNNNPSINLLGSDEKWQPDNTKGSGAYIDKTTGHAILNSGKLGERIGSTLILSPVSSDIAALKEGQQYTLNGHVTLPKGKVATQLDIQFSKYGQVYNATVDSHGNFSIKITVPQGGIQAIYLKHDKYGNDKDALTYDIDKLSISGSSSDNLEKDAEKIENDPDFKKYVANLKSKQSDYEKELIKYNSDTSLIQRTKDRTVLETDWENLRNAVSESGLSQYIAAKFPALPSVKSNLEALTNLVLQHIGLDNPEDPKFSLPDDPHYSWRDASWIPDKTSLPPPLSVPGLQQNSYIDSSGNLIINSVNHTASSFTLDSDSSSLKNLHADKTYTFTGQLSMLVPQGKSPSSLKRLFVVINGQEYPVTVNKDGTFSAKFTVPPGGIKKFQLLLDKDWIKPPQKPENLQIKISDINLFQGDVGNVEESRMKLDGDKGINNLLKNQLQDFISKYDGKIKTLNDLINKAENDPNLTKAQYLQKMKDFRIANESKAKLEKEINVILGSDKQAFTEAASKLLPGLSKDQLNAAVNWVFDDQVMRQIPSIDSLDNPPVPNTGTDGLDDYSEMLNLDTDSNFSSLMEALRGDDPECKNTNIETIAKQMNEYLKDLKAYQKSYTVGKPDPQLYLKLVQLHQKINSETKDEFKNIIKTSGDSQVQAIANLWTNPDGTVNKGLQNEKINDLFTQLTSDDAGGWHVAPCNLIPPPPPPGYYINQGKLVQAPSMIKNGDFSDKSLSGWQSNYPKTIGKYAKIESPSEAKNDPEMPQGYLNSLQITTTKESGHVELHQYVEPVTPGKYYLVSWYQQGDQAGLTVDGAGGSDADGTKPYTQTQVGQNGKAWTRQYMWVKASAKNMETDPTTGKQCLKVSIYADHPYPPATETHSAFQDIRVTPLNDPTKGDNSYQADQIRNQDFNRLANAICPPFALNQDVNSWEKLPLAGQVPQLRGPIKFPSENKPGGNLLDPGISNWYGNPGKHGTPFWGLGTGVQQINELNKKHGLRFQEGGIATAYPKTGLPKGAYQFQERVYVPKGEASAQVTIQTKNEIDQTAGQTITQNFNNLKPGWNTVTVNVDPTKNPNFFEGPEGARYKITLNTQCTSGTFDATGFSLTSKDSKVYQSIRTNNPYDPNNQNNSNKNNNNYDIKFGGQKGPQFNNHNKSDPTINWRDKFGIAPNGNDMLNANLTKDHVDPYDPAGLKITNNVNAKGNATTGGVVGKTPLPSGADWLTSIDFSMKCTGKDHPTIGFWTYGEKKNPYDSEAHNGGPAHRITESDIEIGSDDPDKKFNSDQCYRARDYEGYVNGGGNSQGGRAEKLPKDPSTDKPINLYDGSKWRLSIQGVYEKGANGKPEFHIIKKAIKLDPKTGQPVSQNESFTLSDHNFGDVVIPPHYVKFGLENPDWNKESHQEGSASVYITNFHEQTFGAKTTTEDFKDAGKDWANAVGYDNTKRQIPMKDIDFLVNNSDKGDNVTDFPDKSYYTEAPLTQNK